MPFSPLYLILLVLLVGILLAFVQVGLLTIAFEKLGLSAASTFTLLYASLFGSLINLPLFKIKAEQPSYDMFEAMPALLRGLLRQRMPEFTGKTLIAVNVGGGLIPIVFSWYLIQHHPLSLTEVVTATAIVSAISYVTSRPVPGLGIGMPIFVGPVAAALTAILVSPEHSAPLAYICGTLGVLIGADLLRLKDIRKMGAPIASIGGAGTFDGIFITGIVAVLLA